MAKNDRWEYQDKRITMRVGPKDKTKWAAFAFQNFMKLSEFLKLAADFAINNPTEFYMYRRSKNYG